MMVIYSMNSGGHHGKYGHVRIDGVKTTQRMQPALYWTYLLDLYGLLEQRFATPAKKHLNLLLYRFILLLPYSVCQVVLTR